MEQLELDATDGIPVQAAHGLKNHFLRLKRQTEDRMDDDRNLPPVQFLKCRLKTGERISPSDIAGSGFMDRLKSQLHPDRFLAVQPFQQFQNIRFQTVRPCGNGKHHYLRVGDGFRKNLFQIFHRRIGIGVCLKICDILSDRPLVPDHSFLRLKLFRNGKSPVTGEIPGTARAAENTASGSAGTVPVRTGHPAA